MRQVSILAEIGMRRTIIFVHLLLPLGGAPTTALAQPRQADHREFDAALEVPFRGPPQPSGAGGAVHLHFQYPDAGRRHLAWWRLSLAAPSGAVLRRWQGQLSLGPQPRRISVRWDGRDRRQRRQADGLYRWRLQAGVRGEAGQLEQAWDMAVGAPPTLAMPAYAGLPSARTPAAAPAPDALPYTVYLGNLHSQSGHSDGGGPLESCQGAQPPQSSPLGPAEAYAYARAHGLDFLMSSEHNHMYDGSDSNNPDADAGAARALYQRGLAEASTFRAAHPDFLALYGMEWGVISQGGHLNIFNSEQLLGWERNRDGQLLADSFSARSDYASLYRQMRDHGWIGQFNHPQDGQFRVDGRSFGYSADGDTAMVLCEVMNSNAFSRREDEGETRLSLYEASCRRALEAGYHLAFSSDQDNHCANWGAAYSNRTGVLIAREAPLSAASLLEALRARRVYATMDKDSQLLLSANGHLMGERFSNSGPLALSVRYANAAGRSPAALTIFAGVPGQAGSTAALADTADTTVLPTPGAHFYYARLTQDDGRMLWSAPVWIDQQP